LGQGKGKQAAVKNGAHFPGERGKIIQPKCNKPVPQSAVESLPHRIGAGNPSAMTPLTKQVLHCLRDNVLPMIPLGVCEGSGGKMLVAGEERWTRYFLQRFHGNEWSRKELGRFRGWQLPALLRRHRERADVTLARLDPISIRMFGMQGFLQVPEWVRMVAPVPAPDAQVPIRSTRDDLRAIRKKGLSWRVSRDPQDLRLHLERDYYPYTRRRYGDDAFVQPPDVMWRAFQKGGLMFVEDGVRAIAGMVFELRQTTLQMWSMACMDSDESHLNRKALAGVYAFSFECARSFGMDFVDMRGCRPSPSDSLFFVKHKWGAQVRDHGETAFEFLFDWKEVNGAVRSFLEKTPLIFRDGKNLSVMGTAAGQQTIRWRNAGLHRFVVAESGSTILGS
jgi:hypothetical protein